MTDKLQKVVWTGDETGEEWDLKHEQEEAYFEALSQTLRPCPQHGNPAALEDWREYGFVILANPCGCWLREEFYDSTEAMVDAWNDQPHIGRLTAEIESLRAKLEEAQQQIRHMTDVLAEYERQEFDV